MRPGPCTEIQDSQAVGTIIDDDGLPALTISDEVMQEGNSGIGHILKDDDVKVYLPSVIK